MTAINRLSSANSIASGDLFSVEESRAKEKTSIDVMTSWLSDNFVPSNLPKRIFDRQSATVSEGGTVSMNDTSNDLWFFGETENGAALTAASLVFPLSPVEQQFILIQWVTGSITTLTKVPGAAGVTILSAAGGASSSASTAMSMFIFDATRRFWVSTS